MTTIPASDDCWNTAPARTVCPPPVSVRPQPPRPVVAITPATMRLGHGARVDETLSEIGSGIL
jgi:hypothetical protein